MPARRFLLNPSRTAKQGAQINVGKDNAEYQAIVNTLSMCTADMESMGLAAGDSVRVRTEFGVIVNYVHENASRGRRPAG